MIRNGGRIAVDAVLRLELTLEVGRPDLVRRVGLEAGRARMSPLPSAATLAELAVSIENGVDRAASGKVVVRMSSLEKIQELLRSSSVLLAKGKNLLLDLLGRLVRMPSGSSRSIFDRLQPLRTDPLDPLVSGRP